MPLAEAAAGEALEGASLAWLRDRWVWRLETEDGLRLVDAAGGKGLAAMEAEEAGDRATALRKAPAEVLQVVEVAEAEGEIRGRKLPLWRVDFDDADNSRIYLDALTGEVAAVRTDAWRLFDFFWMLHIMDYSERTDFSHPLLIGASVLGVASALTGILLAAAIYLPRRRK